MHWHNTRRPNTPAGWIRTVKWSRVLVNGVWTIWTLWTIINEPSITLALCAGIYTIQLGDKLISQQIMTNLNQFLQQIINVIDGLLFDDCATSPFFQRTASWHRDMEQAGTLNQQTTYCNFRSPHTITLDHSYCLLVGRCKRPSYRQRKHVWSLVAFVLQGN